MSNVITRNTVRVIGEGEQTIVLGHGLGCDQTTWKFIIPFFEKKYRIILFDYVGSGKSDLTAYQSERYKTLAGYAQDLLEIVEALEIKQSIFIGHSVSSMIGALAGKNYLSLVHEEDVPVTLEAIQNLLDQKSVFGFTNRFRCKNGSYKYIEWNIEPNGTYMYCSGRDVTEKRELEEKLSQSNAELLQLTEEMKVKNQLLEALAITDELTGAFNRHFFDQKSSEKMEISDRYNPPLSMIIMDLDHFKRVNDTWGHPVGDEVLKQTAKIARRNLRKSDVFFRFGGEEFIMLLLPRTSISSAVHVAENIRKALEQNQLPTVGKVTASFGVAQRVQFESFETWYKRLDEALYCAKEGGRNRVATATS